MSKTVAQIFATNPTTIVADTDLYYLVQSPYTPGTDAAITGASLKAAFSSGGTINPGLAGQLAYYAGVGTAISGLTSAANSVLITSNTGAPSISSTLPTAVQNNITNLGTISSIGAPLGSSFGGTGVNNGGRTVTIGGNFAMSGAFAFTGTLTNTTTVTFPTSGTLATTAQLPTPSALTSSNDTNVTITLGGTPATSLLQAVSLTMGWSGTLSGTRGGTGVNNGANTITLGGNLLTAGSFTTVGAFAVTQTYTAATSVTFPTSGTLATTSQLPTPAALTVANDTNVTLTLGGTPATALLQAASVTAGWTGTLSGTRGGTGVNNGASTITIGGSVTYSGAFTFTGTLTNTTAVTFPTSGTLATTSQIPSLPLSLANGGTGAALTASNGGIVYSNASTLAILAGTATANQLLLSGASTTPAWSTSTYPATNAINTLLYASAANVMSALATANSSILVTNSSGVPAWGTTLPAFTSGNHTFSPTTAGIVGTTTNDNTSAGNVGEYAETILLVGSQVSLTSTVVSNITSVPLTAGDWDVWGEVWFNAAGTTVVTSVSGSVNASSGSFPTVPATGSSLVALAFTGIAEVSTGIQHRIAITPCRVSLSGTTAYYLNAASDFSTSTMAAYGKICARRRR